MFNYDLETRGGVKRFAIENELFKPNIQACDMFSFI